MECRNFMKSRQFAPFPTGEVLITDGYALPSKKVIHTVGPIARFPGDEQSMELRKCYITSLDAAAHQGIRSIAFCCISTGVFGYPQEGAARVALESVREWLSSSPLNNDRMDYIVFNVFTQKDWEIYTSYGPQIFASDDLSLTVHHLDDHHPTAISGEEELFRRAARLIKGASSIFITAGAGASIDAGVNFYDKKTFKARYPGMVKRGYHFQYQLVGNPDLKRDPRLMWGYMIHSIYHTRFSDSGIDLTTYRLIKDLLNGKDSSGVITGEMKPHFVYTSNVDGLFQRSGFAPDRIYTPQGDMAYFQCLNKCTPSSYWESEPIIRDLLDKVDKETSLLDASLIPRCPTCNGPSMYNLRGGDFYLHHDIYNNAKKRMQSFISGSLARPGERMVILDIGSGFNTPSVIRWPVEEIAASHENVSLVRINLEHPTVDNYPHLEVSDRFVGIPAAALTAIRGIHRYL